MQNNVSIIIPAFNEAQTIQPIIDRVLAIPFVRQLVIVDDASTDRTREILESMTDARIELIRHAVNQGKTAAIVSGLRHVTGDIVVIQDADLEYDPEEIQFLCQPIWDDQADVVYGSRFLVRRASRVIYFYHYLGNKVISFLSNVFTNKNMSDIETCYKAFRTFVIKTMPITSRHFGFEVEVTAKISKTDSRIYETPISYHGRTYEQGKKISFIDGVFALLYILRYNLWRDARTRAYIEDVNQRLADRDRGIAI